MNKYSQLFAACLEEKNLKFDSYETNGGDSIIDVPYDGKISKAIFSGDDGQYFSLYIFYEKVPEEKMTEAVFLCNELNTKYKWVTFFVDTDNDFVFHDDAILSEESAADEAFELLIRMLKIGDDLKPQIMKMIYA